MTATVAELVERLGAADFNLRARALAGLVALGRGATSALLPLLGNPDAALRALATRALAEAGDPDCAEAFARALRDPDCQVRARAAQGLARIGDARAVDALILTLNDYPDVLHDPATLATHLLTKQGVAALPRVIPLLRAADLATRRRAWLVVHGIVTRLNGATGWATLWHSLGGYRPDAPVEERDAAAARWQVWVARGMAE